jgi:protein-S-isoprenylcysteine O-methyltransferase Ste14
MSKMPRIVAIISIVAGVILIIAGGVTYYVVHRELADQKITVSADAKNFAGKDVAGPFTAYAQAMAIKGHAEKIGGGKTYAELPQDDPNRQTVLTASFLQASLFTSVVAFGVAALVMGLGVLFILVGLAFLGVEKQIGRKEPTDVPAPEPAAATA